jgi:hypothetical protein
MFYVNEFGSSQRDFVVVLCVENLRRQENVHEVFSCKGGSVSGSAFAFGCGEGVCVRQNVPIHTNTRTPSIVGEACTWSGSKAC